MAKNNLAVLVYKLNNLGNFLRKVYLQLLGLNIKKGSKIGKITCQWPNKVKIGGMCTIQDGVDFRLGLPFNASNYIEIADRVFIGRGTQINCSSRIIIGNDCLIAGNTIIVDISHETNRCMPINKQECYSEQIIIGDDVWIGAGSIILKGVIIGNGSIIGAGSLVNKTVPEKQIWAGVPAKFIRHRE